MPDAAERQWGDFQTPAPLAREICQFLHDHLGCRPDLIVEPTAGEGSFLGAALERFPRAEVAYAVEIQPRHVATLRERFGQAPNIHIHHDDFFHHRFPEWLSATPGREVLILGNPPWVTNAELSTLGSGNLPDKHNFKGHHGLVAVTGKGNFDLAESVIRKCLESFHGCSGYLAVLCKTAVVRNLLEQLPRTGFSVTEAAAYRIDAHRHFGAKVEASLLVLRLGAASTAFTCDVYNWSDPARRIGRFGWSGPHFVADVDGYQRWRHLDGRSPFEWRQGIKHDCSRVMELSADLHNGLGEQVDVEPEALYPLLKSSDLQHGGTPHRWIPLPQRSLQEDTESLAGRYPKLWGYLQRHRPLFDARKSSIYRRRPPFSIFGIGEYSFAPYKVAISGMYKEPVFTLVPPVDGRPVMLDDTTYFLGFDSCEEAAGVCAALNGEAVQGFLRAVAFRDAKRPYTKELLMRVNPQAAL